MVRAYENSSVNVENFLAALSCDENRSGPCVGPPATANATLFIFWAGHGGNLFLLFPDMQTSNALYANVFVAALRKVLGGANGTLTSTSFWSISFPASVYPACAASYDLPGAHADWGLTGAWNPMAWPIWGFRLCPDRHLH